MQYDAVNNPKHYVKHMPKVMPADLLETLPHNLAQTFKYLIRCEDKGNYLQDISKAHWYLNRFFDDEKTYSAHAFLTGQDYKLCFDLSLGGASQWFWLCKTNRFFAVLNSTVKFEDGEAFLVIYEQSLHSLRYYLKELIEKDERQLELKFE